MEAAGKHSPTRKHFGRFDPCQDGFTRVFRQYKLDRSLGFALDDRYAFPDAVVFDEIGNGQLDQITATQLAVDGDVEQNQIA